MRMSRGLLLSLVGGALLAALLIAAGGCGMLGANVTREQAETTQAAVNKSLEAPAGVTASAEGDVNIIQGKEAVEAARVLRSENLNTTASESAWKKVKNPWTLAIIAGGLLALFLVVVYIARKTGADKAAKTALERINTALEHATDEKTMLALERAKSALQK